MKTKLIAMYLPQYHEIRENSLFWGEGYTDWVAVKKAKPFLENQVEPRVPLNNNYYDLADPEVLRWQAKLAKEHGVYGFGIYHYWFNNEQNLLTKPAENLLANKDIELPFFFAWDNSNWKRSWSKVRGNDWNPIMDNENKPKLDDGKEILVEFILGDEKDWKKHFDWLLPYFKDDRYIKIKNKPLFFMFYHSKDIDRMVEYWNELAKENGFDGMHVAYNNTIRTRLEFVKGLNYYNYQPTYVNFGPGNPINFLKKKLFGKDKKIREYDWVWKKIIRSIKRNNGKHVFDGLIAMYDDSPRRGEKAMVFVNASPEKLEKYLSKALKITSKQGKEYVFLTAWNEWGEGAYLEPDETYGYQYLEAVKRAVDSLDD